jgi:hypothetical protein
LEILEMIQPNLTWALAFTACCALTSPAFAQTICNAALQSNAFNTSDYSQTSRILINKRDEACRSEYSSAAEAQEAARNAGASIGYGPFSFGASDARRTASSKYSIAESNFCRASAEALDSFTTSTARQSVADFALKEWSNCIKTTASNRLFVRYDPRADGSGLTGQLLRYLGGQGSLVTKITRIAADSDGVTCSVGGETVPVNQPIDVPVDRSPIVFTCRKAPSLTASIALRTTEGDQAWITMPSVATQQQLTVDALSDAINTLRRQLATAVPKDTVAAFNLPICPEGWTALPEAAGRTIVGAGSGTGLTARVFGSTGGEERHTLTVAEMPRHRHQLPTFNGVAGSREIGSGHYGADLQPQEFTEFEGSGQPHNVMPPFLVLTQCKKL